MRGGLTFPGAPRVGVAGSCEKSYGPFSQVTFGKAVVTIFVFDDSSGRRLAAAFVAAFSRVQRRVRV